MGLLQCKMGRVAITFLSGSGGLFYGEPTRGIFFVTTLLLPLVKEAFFSLFFHGQRISLVG